MDSKTEDPKHFYQQLSSEGKCELARAFIQALCHGLSVTPRQIQGHFQGEIPFSIMAQLALSIVLREAATLFQTSENELVQLLIAELERTNLAVFAQDVPDRLPSDILDTLTAEDLSNPDGI